MLCDSATVDLLLVEESLVGGGVNQVHPVFLAFPFSLWFSLLYFIVKDLDLYGSSYVK